MASTGAASELLDTPVEDGYIVLGLSTGDCI